MRWVFLPIALSLFSAAAAARAGDGSAAAPPAPERVRRIARELEALRGKKFKREVEVERQATEDFRRFVERQLEKELPAAEAAAQSKALEAFGLLPKGYDLRKGLADLYVSQAGAYYDPETKKFYVLMAKLPDNVLDDLVLHELTHALQDQYFDLAAAIAKAKSARDDDAEAAFTHLVEGEATYVTLRKQLGALGLALDRADSAGDMALEEVRDMGRETLLSATRLVAQRLGPDAADLKKAMEALSGVPDYLFWSLHAPYIKGQFAVHKAAASGWAGVDALFERPPDSTEQVLHPEKLVGAERDEPSPLSRDNEYYARVLGEPWKLVRANTLGELGTRVFFETFLPAEKKPEAAKAAAGWDGDRYFVYEGPGGSLALMWFTIWDSAQDADEFAAALKTLARPALGKTTIVAKGQRVIYADMPGGPTEKFLRIEQGDRFGSPAEETAPR